ncbi:MAG: CPBP family intramembrane glutamic endopeptidase [Solirubrobacterales bacterium]
MFIPPSGSSAASSPGGETGADRWPARFGVLSAILGFVAAQVVIGVLAIIYVALGGDIDTGSGDTKSDPAFVVAASVVQGVIFAATAVAIARTIGPVRACDFGLVRARLWPTVGKVVVFGVAYYAALAVYAELVNLTSDDAPDKLGAAAGTFGMLAFALVAAVIAPIAEEFFFRGMVFRALANGLGVVGGAVVSGVFFGSLHIDSLAQERLLQVVPLMILGIVFALLYAWSGTLYASIALHATNNSLAVIAYAADKQSEFGIVLGAVLWLTMMAFCLFGWRLTDRPNRPGPMVAPERPEPAATVS